jgi:hypothetical protein
MLTAYAMPVPSEVEKVKAPSLAMARSLPPLLRKTNVPVRPDTVPPIVTVTGGGGGLFPPLPSSSPPPHAAQSANTATRIARLPKSNNVMVHSARTAPYVLSYDVSGELRTWRR